MAAAIELDPAYVDVIVRRWQSVTGREAMLNGKVTTFADAEARRMEVHL